MPTPAPVTSPHNVDYLFQQLRIGPADTIHFFTPDDNTVVAGNETSVARISSQWFSPLAGSEPVNEQAMLTRIEALQLEANMWRQRHADLALRVVDLLLDERLNSRG